MSVDTSTVSGSGETIQAVKVPSNADKARGQFFFSETFITNDHPIFTQGTISPVSQLIGIPILIWRVDPRPSLSIPRSADYDNQFTTYLMIEPHSGFADMPWQQGIGSVIAARADRKPLPTTHLEAIWMFISKLLDQFSCDEPPTPQRDMTRARFVQFYANYRKNQLRQHAEKARWEATPLGPYDL